jgi:cytosine/uracil/thiamine/allantoin permease
MITENILTYGIHPGEVVCFLIFLWASSLFISVRKHMIKIKFVGGDYYIFWVAGMVFFCIQQFLDVLDNLKGLRFLNYIEHITFLLGAVLFTYGIYKSYRKYGVERKDLK